MCSKFRLRSRVVVVMVWLREAAWCTLYAAKSNIQARWSE